MAVHDATGQIASWFGTCTDIHDIKEAEASLDRYRTELESRVQERTAQLAEATKRAEAASEAKSGFLATMSHEIRTPMNGVLGSVEILSLTQLDARQADLLRTISESGKALLSIIDDILDFSKIEADRLQLEVGPVALGDVVEGVCELLLPAAAAQNIEIDAFVDPRLPPLVLADEVRLRQLLYNLVGNAIKFSAGTGRKGRVEVRCGPGGGDPMRVALVVRDNGIGMTRATQARLFEPFFQAQSSTHRRFGGTGLGLPICKRVADLMGGTIDVVSVPDAGATFTITLPLEALDALPLRRLPDLAGVTCAIDPDVPHPPAAVRAYLEHAGALVAPDGGVRIAAHPPGPGERRPTVVLSRSVAPEDAPQRYAVPGALLRREKLLDAVARAAGRAAPAGLATGAVPVSLPSPVDAAASGALILVAEDDPINQRVVLQQLALLGYAAEIAGDGRAALRLWRQGKYALVLTDLHMPYADGHAVVRAIRRAEARHGTPRVPIVALTATAIRGEAERALAAGFDAFLTKPVQLSELRGALERFLGARRDAAAPSTVGAQGLPVLDVNALARLVGNDAGVIHDVLEAYRTAALPSVADLVAACRAGRAEEVAAAAHKLKSSSRSVGALALGELCAAMEREAKAGRTQALAELATAAEVAAGAVAAALDAHPREQQ